MNQWEIAKKPDLRARSFKAFLKDLNTGPGRPVPTICLFIFVKGTISKMEFVKKASSPAINWDSENLPVRNGIFS